MIRTELNEWNEQAIKSIPANPTVLVNTLLHQYMRDNVEVKRVNNKSYAMLGTIVVAEQNYTPEAHERLMCVYGRRSL